MLIANDASVSKCVSSGSWLSKTRRDRLRGSPLEQQIDLAAQDGVITASRRRRAHEEIRTLGNDVLHDEWREVTPSEVKTAKGYAAYLHRETVLALLRDKKRVTDDGGPSDIADRDHHGPDVDMTDA